MGLDYSRVLNQLKVGYDVIGRGKKSAEIFKSESNYHVITGGVEKILQNDKVDVDTAIVTVGAENLTNVSCLLLENGFKRLLVEKPGGLNIEEICKLEKMAKSKNAQVFIAYNRRFYSSTIKAKEIIKKDGGVTSFNFEFTEFAHKIKSVKKHSLIKENWFIANSTHVIDLAIFLGGYPCKYSTFTKGGLSWHPSASIFSGAGITDHQALFSYSANWEAPGRWGVEVLTRKHRLIFRPLEKLKIQKIDSFERLCVSIDDKLDIKYKPGIYEQTKAFLSNNNSNLCSIDEHKSNFEFYSKIIHP
tara:strand:- start:150 stop:1058 length:909 start_codon:yes stop_codon:yes gene_type:complete